MQATTTIVEHIKRINNIIRVQRLLREAFYNSEPFSNSATVSGIIGFDTASVISWTGRLRSTSRRAAGMIVEGEGDRVG